MLVFTSDILLQYCELVNEFGFYFKVVSYYQILPTYEVKTSLPKALTTINPHTPTRKRGFNLASYTSKAKIDNAIGLAFLEASLPKALTTLNPHTPTRKRGFNLANYTTSQATQAKLIVKSAIGLAFLEASLPKALTTLNPHTPTRKRGFNLANYTTPETRFQPRKLHNPGNEVSTSQTTQAKLIVKSAIGLAFQKSRPLYDIIFKKKRCFNEKNYSC